MPKVGSEWNDISDSSAVADYSGRRQGRVSVVLGKGLFRIRWSDGEQEIVPRPLLLARYTTQSAKY